MKPKVSTHEPIHQALERFAPDTWRHWSRDPHLVLFEGGHYLVRWGGLQKRPGSNWLVKRADIFMIQSVSALKEAE